ncbi:MAG: bifunctional phosphopantothenoylcysteine decarboxylase/phosphopantothenate--cysteine ligase CoaBC [Dehalococcoidia bacterium]|nr:bifunctional phosphopantothenoylcysteine decarboxylase/phosphopantothenate--cysteine ligase CoaBC [Dehalococcoidia bacterium]
MTGVLQGKNLVLGVTGSIACYKALDLASKLTQAGANVDTIMSYGATQFIPPLAFRSLTHRPVIVDTFDPDSELSIEHVQLAEKADLVVVAPATAHFIAKVAWGFADDPLTTTILATTAPVLIAPAMDGHMYENQATQDNIEKLKTRGIRFVGPASGHLASGLTGIGRLVEVPQLVGHISALLGRDGDLAGRTIVVSAGGTQEAIDPVRVITNHSSGKMGYALAEAARDRGARVVLVSAPTGLDDPAALEVVKVRSASEMRDAVLEAVKGADALVMAAAVADYQPADVSDQKIKKDSSALTIELERTPDILMEAQGSFLKIGFAAETEELLANAKDKLDRKALDLIVANDVSKEGSGFGADTNKVTLVGKSGEVEDLPLMSKHDVAHRILDRVKALLG